MTEAELLDILADRVEIISPGHLPDHLDTDQIRFGLSNLRNAALASHAFHMLPYRGLGSGIPSATEAWPDIDLVDDRKGNQFNAIVRRSAVGKSAGLESQPESQPESLAERVLGVLRVGPHGKAEIARALGQKTVSGQLNKTIRELLAERRIAMTIPENPQSRLQKYRLTDYKATQDT
jgi:ATP-dependent DNA helicase RecG